MAQFHETVMGHKFYSADVPRLLKALERIAGALESSGTDKALEKIAAEVAEVARTARADGDDPVNVAQYREERDAEDAAAENEEEAISLAKQIYESDDVNIDDDAEVAMVFGDKDDPGLVTGAWVAARVFVVFEANADRCPGCGAPVEHKGKPIFDPLTGKTHTKTECVRCDVLGNKGGK